MTELKNCPFCGSGDIRYSFKVKGTTYKQYYATMYCNGCHAYGTRTLTDKIKWDNYTDRRNYETDEQFKVNAIAAWNTRVETSLQSRINELETAIRNHLEYPLMGSKELKEVLGE